MPTERLAGVAAAVVAAALVALPATAQDPLSGINPATQVRSLAFRFGGTTSFEVGELRQQIALTDPASTPTSERWLAKLPFGPDLPQHPFSPLELQRDVVRLRRFYQRGGFLGAAVDYRVRYDDSANLVDVEFLIDEGEPIRVAAVRFTWSGDSLPPDLASAWARFTPSLAVAPGGRLDAAAVTRGGTQVRQWLGDRGYPFVSVEPRAAVDSGARLADLEFVVAPRPRGRVASITVEGNTTVADGVIRRQLPFEVGDRFSAREVNGGARQLERLDIIQLARVDLVPDQPRDSTVAVRVWVQEARPRQITGGLGYISDGGIAGSAEWSHRNFGGSARTLTASAVTETGELALVDNPDRFLRGLLSLRQPYVADPRVSAAVTPFFEYRDDYRDQSWQLGVSGTLIYSLGALQSVALEYRLSRRRVIEYRFGDFSAGEVGLLELLGQALIDSLGEDILESTVGLSATVGALDVPSHPRRGWVIRPSATVTTPSGLNTTEYLRLDLTGNAFYPLGKRVGFVARVSAGRLRPFGKSVPASTDSAGVEYLLLRDVVFTAGGTNDVRGWATRELGPKVPDVRLNIEGSDTVPEASRYAPVGGLARIAASVEVRLPLPGLGPKWGAHVFVDGGRVWTADQRFELPPVQVGGQRLLEGDLGLEEFFFATGLGVDWRTPLGPLRAAMGYKLNPSVLDLRDPEDVLAARAAGQPIESAPTDWKRRFQFHFSLGVTY